MSQIGRYEIVGQTGNHGLGSLYQAFDPVMARPVMIRIADRSTNPGVSFDQARQAILFDAKQLAHLDHPNIIKFLACEEDDGRPYLVMERFEGKPLSGVLSQEKLAGVLKNKEVDLIDCSSGGLVPYQKIPIGPAYQVGFSQRIREATGILTGTVGLITDAVQAESILTTGQADLIVMARQLLRDPYFPLHAADELRNKEMHWPLQYERARLK